MGSDGHRVARNSILGRILRIHSVLMMIAPLVTVLVATALLAAAQDVRRDAEMMSSDGLVVALLIILGVSLIGLLANFAVLVFPWVWLDLVDPDAELTEASWAYLGVDMRPRTAGEWEHYHQEQMRLMTEALLHASPTPSNDADDDVA